MFTNEKRSENRAKRPVYQAACKMSIDFKCVQLTADVVRVVEKEKTIQIGKQEWRKSDEYGKGGLRSAPSFT